MNKTMLSLVAAAAIASTVTLLPGRAEAMSVGATGQQGYGGGDGCGRNQREHRFVHWGPPGVFYIRSVS